MCNIAGYVGEKRAAPILLEMISRQQVFDGGCCAGIVTIHEGKFYMRKVVGSVEDLIRETDALDLPGTIGIAHTRPGGGKREAVAHPFISSSGKTASVANGALRDVKDRISFFSEICEMLCSEGFEFSSMQKSDKPSYFHIKSGYSFHPADVFCGNTEHYLNKGASGYPEAMAKMMTDFYSDTVSVMLNIDNAKEIFVTRNTRPMFVLSKESETYIATAPFGFLDENDAKYATLLPAVRSSVIRAGGYTVTEHFVKKESVCPITREVYSKGYKIVEELLLGKKDAPCCYDDVENALYARMDIWDEPRLLSQYAVLAYEILFAMKLEGRLKGDIRPDSNNNKRNLFYMYI